MEKKHDTTGQTDGARAGVSSGRGPRRTEVDNVELIEGYLGGDGSTVRSVDEWIRRELRRHYRSLYREHEDLAQTIHEKLLANLRQGKFQGDSPLHAYVRAITNHTCLDRLRRVYRERVFAEPTADVAVTVNPYRRLEARQQEKLLHQMVLALPETCRRLWYLVFCEKLSYEEIGKRLTIPSGTVKSRMSRCRDKAIELLEKLRHGTEPSNRLDDLN